jgi:hypothetical protein
VLLLLLLQGYCPSSSDGCRRCARSAAAPVPVQSCCCCDTLHAHVLLLLLLLAPELLLHR